MFTTCKFLETVLSFALSICALCAFACYEHLFICNQYMQHILTSGHFAFFIASIYISEQTNIEISVHPEHNSLYT